MNNKSHVPDEFELDCFNADKQNMIDNLSKEVLTVLCKALEDHKPNANLIVNVLTVCIFRVVYDYISEEDENRFIVGLSKTLKANFTANRRGLEHVNAKINHPKESNE